MNWFLSWTLLINIWLINWLTTNQTLWWLLIIIFFSSLFWGKKIFYHIQWYKWILAVVFTTLLVTNTLWQNQIRPTSNFQTTAKATVSVSKNYTNFYIVTDQKKQKHYLSKFYYQKGSQKKIEADVYDRIQLCYKSKKITNKQKRWLWLNFQVQTQIYAEGKKCAPKVWTSQTFYRKIKTFLTKNNWKINQRWINFLLFQKTNSQLWEAKNTMMQMGIIHLFVISGFHLTILVRLWIWISKKTRNKTIKILLEILGLLFGVFLVYLTNWKFSASKAFLFLFWNWINKKRSVFHPEPKEQIAFLALLFLVFNPLLFYQIGFQLSCLVSWFVFFNSPNNNSSWKEKIKTNCLILIVVLPILINIQHQISVLVILYTIIYGLITALFYPIFFVTIWLKPIWPIWKTVFFYFEQKLSFIKIWDPTITFGWWDKNTITFYYCLTVVLAALTKANWQKVVLIVLLLINLTALTFNNWRQKNFQIHLINVGHGLAVFIQGPNKNTNILLDAGSGKTAVNNSNRISKYLKKLAVSELDAVFISHNHFDHYNNLKFLTKQFVIKQIITNQEQKTHYKVNEISFQNLAYPYYQTMKKENNRGLVLWTKINGYRILFTFDLEKEGEEKIITNFDLKPIDILQVGHHGSKSSSQALFLSLIKPKYCLISSNKEQTKVNHNLKKINCQTFNTKEKNNIKLTLDKPIKVNWE